MKTKLLLALFLVHNAGICNGCTTGTQDRGGSLGMPTTEVDSISQALTGINYTLINTNKGPTTPIDTTATPPFANTTYSDQMQLTLRCALMEFVGPFGACVQDNGPGQWWCHGYSNTTAKFNFYTAPRNPAHPEWMQMMATKAPTRAQIGAQYPAWFHSIWTIPGFEGNGPLRATGTKSSAEFNPDPTTPAPPWQVPANHPYTTEVCDVSADKLHASMTVWTN